MQSSLLKKHLLRSTMIATMAALSTWASAANAQEDAATEAPADESLEQETIYVTGSRIGRSDFIANSPITTVGAEEISLSGAVSIEGLLNELPQVVPGLSSTSNNPGLGGQSSVDLRGLGTSSTLVLINGRRLAPSDKSGLVDINLIPASMVKSVEVVTGGASAVYGSDAVAGVVNFILKDDFEGFEIGALTGMSSEGDAKESTIDFTMGGNLDSGRGNVTISGSYFTRDALLQSERGYSEVATYPSSRVEAGSIVQSLTNPFPSGAGTLWISEDGTSLGSPEPYNFAPVNNLLLPTDRVNLNGYATYEVNEYVEAYASTLFSSSTSTAQLAPSPVSASAGVTVPADLAVSYFTDPELIAEIEGRDDPDAPLTIQRRMTEVGPRISTADKNFYQILGGARGDVKGWNWDVFYQYARSETNESLTNDIDKDRFQSALNGCPEGSEAGCTTINPFGVGSITEEQADWIRLSNVTDTTKYEQQVLQGSISGDLFELPAGPLGVAIGAEYRSDYLDFSPAPDSQGNLIGFNAVYPSSGKVTVREIFGEALVPIVKDAPLAQAITLELGARYSDYSSVGGLDVFKIGGDWEVNDALRFRAMYNKSARAPSVFELYRAGDQNFPGYGDPCNNATTAYGVGTAEYNFCAEWLGLDPADAATADTLDAFSQSDSQVESYIFGNPDLEEETSETVTAGIVLTRDFGFRDFDAGTFSAAIDYYEISVEDAIGTESARNVIDNCFATLDLDSEACQAAPRLSSGQLAGIETGYVNRSSVDVSGVDFTGTWSRSLLGGEIDVNALVSWLDKYEVDGYDYAGMHAGLGGARPEWKSNVRTTYSYNDWQFSWQWERIGEMDDYGYSAAYGYPMVDAIDYHDFSVRWFVTDSTEVTLICENCLDQDPQEGTVSGYVSGPNIDASTYDGIGRYFRLGVRTSF